MEGNVTLQTQTTAAYQIVRWNSLVVLNVANTLPVSCHTHTHTHTHTHIYVYIYIYIYIIMVMMPRMIMHGV